MLVTVGTVCAKPSTVDSNLKVEHLIDLPFKPSNMAFVAERNILVLSRDDGKVYQILNNVMNPKPVLDVNVANIGYRGMLGIDSLKVNDLETYVFLYFTESVAKDGDDEIKGGNLEPLGNRLYRYQFEEDKLVKPKLLLDLPVKPGPRHTGGEVAVGPDKNIYVTVGDMDGTFNSEFETLTQNYNNATMVDGRSGILRVTPDGNPVGRGILGDEFPLNLYYAYGIRNSFGIDWDPLTGLMWDTENGPHYGDELNLVEPGFNSGWVVVHGLWKPNFENIGELSLIPEGLVNFEGKGEYSAPEFIWIAPIAPTALKFFNSTNYGNGYYNHLFVSDANRGTIYNFELNGNRTGLELQGALKDKVSQDLSDTDSIIFATGFGRITDMQLGPDGNLYVLSTAKKGTTLDRISIVSE